MSVTCPCIALHGNLEAFSRHLRMKTALIYRGVAYVEMGDVSHLMIYSPCQSAHMCPGSSNNFPCNSPIKLYVPEFQPCDCTPLCVFLSNLCTVVKAELGACPRNV